jgi:hypothetical protein
MVIGGLVVVTGGGTIVVVTVTGGAVAVAVIVVGLVIVTVFIVVALTVLVVVSVWVTGTVVVTTGRVTVTGGLEQDNETKHSTSIATKQVQASLIFLLILYLLYHRTMAH